jgi:uncharacterized protein YbcV (DUF1398 family)
VKALSFKKYFGKPSAKPNGKTVVATDKIKLMHNTYTYVAVKGSDNVVKFDSKYPFRTTIITTGTPEIDPAYFHVRTSVLSQKQ